MQLSLERQNNYNFIRNYLDSLTVSEKMMFPAGLHKIDDTHSFYVKNTTILNEVIIHSDLTDIAINENVGYILLLFGHSNSHEGSYNLFIELSEGETNVKNMQSKISVINGLLWMHEHDYVHGDIYDNNIFQLGTEYVIADFDKSGKTNQVSNKLDEVSRFFAKLADSIIQPFSELFIYTPGNKRPYLKYEPRLYNVLELCIRTAKSVLRFAKGDQESLQNIETCEALLAEVNAVMKSTELMKQLYDKYIDALSQIAKQNMARGTKKSRKKNKKIRKMKKSRKTTF